MANWLTLSRVPLLGVILVLLYLPAETSRFIAVPLVLILILLDTVDGLVARTRGETSLLGSVLDIAADRMVEYVLWVFFAYLRLISPVIPVLVLIRGTFVDAVRSVAPAHGVRPFDMMRSQVSRFLVGSPFMRTSYAVAKLLAFVLLALRHALLTAADPLADTIALPARVIAWIALFFCLARGIPVLVEAPKALRGFEE